MKINKMKGYVIGTVIGISIGATLFTYGGAYDGFTSTLNWFDMAVKAKLNGIYTSGKMCTSDGNGQIQCITDIPSGGGADPIITPVQNPNCESTFTLSSNTLSGVSYYIQSCNGLKWDANPSTSTMMWATNTGYTEPVWDGTQYRRTGFTTGSYTTGTIINSGDTDYPAFAHCVSKGAGWRLPTKGEMMSIMTVSTKNASNFYTALHSVTYTYYWSDTKYYYSNSFAWGGNFSVAHSYYGTNTNNDRVICVNGDINKNAKWIASPNSKSRFILMNMTGTTVTGAYFDSYTNLKWEANPSTSTINWAANTLYPEPVWDGTKYIYASDRVSTDYPAFKHCTDKGAGWRLPTKNEMMSIMTVSTKNANNFYTALPSISISYYWSSTVYRSDTIYAWRANFSIGRMDMNTKTTDIRVICIHD